MKTSPFFKILLLFVVMSGTKFSSWAQTRKPGELFQKLALTENSFPDKVDKLRRYAYAAEFNFVEFSDFLPTIRDGKLTFVLPDQRNIITAETAFVKVKTPQEYTWTGNILAAKNDGVLGEVILYYNKGRVSGSITYKDEAYQIQPVSSTGLIHVLYRLDKQYKAGTLCGLKDGVGKNEAVPKSNKGAARRDACTGGNIRVFIFYTSDAQNSGLDVNTTINNCIADWNSAASVSNTNSPAMELAGSELLSGFTEGTTSNATVNQFVNFSAFPQVSARREDPNIRADIMVLLCQGSSWTTRGEAKDYGPDASSAYAVIRIADAANANHTFTHEVGHLFGCRHQTANDPTTAYAHGIQLYNVIGQQQNQVTVMHTTPTGSPLYRLNRFSNPSVQLNGYYTGGTNADNARVVRESAAQVQNFRSPVNLPISANISGPTSGNIYCNTYTWEAIYQCGNEGVPVSFEWSLSEDGTNYGNVLGTSETFNQTLYTQFMWIRLRVINNGQVTDSYQQVYGNDVGCGGRKAATDLLTVTEVDTESELVLFDAVPNPVNANTKISFYLKQAQRVTLTISDLTGRPLKIISDQYFEAGKHTHQFSKENLTMGVYLINLSTSNATKTKRIVFQ